MNGKRGKLSNPRELLRYDPRLVVTRARNDVDLLEELLDFALEIEDYIDLHCNRMRSCKNTRNSIVPSTNKNTKQKCWKKEDGKTTEGDDGVFVL